MTLRSTQSGSRHKRKSLLLFHSRLVRSLGNLLPEMRDDLFAGMLGLSLLRYAVSQSVTGHASQGHILMVLDIESAFLCGETKRAISLEVPDEDRNGRNPQLVGKLHKALCGTRDAQQQGQEHLTTTLEKLLVSGKSFVCPVTSSWMNRTSLWWCTWMILSRWLLRTR